MRFPVPLHFQSLKAIENGGASAHRENPELIRVSLSQYGLLLEEMSAAGKPPSSLHGRIHGVFRKKQPVLA
jgi:hypothetical protein